MTHENMMLEAELQHFIGGENYDPSAKYQDLFTSEGQLRYPVDDLDAVFQLLFQLN